MATKKVKSKQVTVKDLQACIKVYTAEIIDLGRKVSGSNESDMNTRRLLTDLLQIGEPRYGTRDLATWPQIIRNIQGIFSKLEGMKISEGQMLPWIHHEQNETNSKLWYLLRAALKDDTLKNEVSNHFRPDTMKGSPFDRPQF